MTGEGCCLNGSPDCKFGGIHELVLVEKIMRGIGNYSHDERISPCPRCLRDTMLAVAALLHLEAVKLRATNRRKDKRFDDEFALNSGNSHCEEIWAAEPRESDLLSRSGNSPK